MRRFLLILFVLIVFTLPTTSSIKARDCGCPKSGDLNFDGKVTVTDLAILANWLAGNVTFTPEQQLAANVLNDEVINVQDLFTMANFLAGNITSLPQEPAQ